MTEVKTLTHEKLEAEHEKITKAYKAIIFEEKKRIQYKNLGAYLKEKKLDNPTQEHKRIAILLNEIIVRQLREYAMLQFLIMEKANEFGAMGEQRVSISFCRNILQIPANREVNQDDADIFRQKIDEFEKDIQVTSVAKLKEMEKSFKLKLLGEQIEILQSSLLDQVFSFIGIPYRLATATFKGEQTFIYGQIEEKIIAGKQVNISGKEIVRSPLYVLSIAAGQGANKGIIIRKESCETIFYNKWVSFFEMNQTERVIYNTHAHSAIREGLKEKALNYYEVSSKNELLKIKDLFIQEMIEGIFYHEVGHEVGERPEVLAEHLAVLGRSRGVMGDDIILVLKEAVADWAPQVGKQSGPIWAFLKKAKKDKNIAQRLLYVYLSDNWFIDSDEEFMGIQTDVLTAFLLSYINKNGSFDFATLEKDFSGIVSFILNKYKSILEKMKVILDEGIYMAGIHRINFQTLEKELHKVYQKEFPNITLEELRKKTNFFIHLLGLVKKFSPDVYNKLEQIIIDSSHQVKMDILERVSKGSAEKYNNNLREFVIQRMVEIGVFKKKETPRIDEAITFLTKTLKIPADLQKKVIKRFNNILEGEAVDIAISYEGKPDPFWAVFQEMLIRSGYGNIRSGMAMGENISPEDSMEEKNKKVKEALENIRDQIESEMYLEVKLLRVNSVYFTEKEFDGILQQLKFYDETNLKDRIASIQYIEIKGNRSMEVYIPLKRGYIDWNTSQAIWRINQELRPEDYLKQWSIDKIFLEALYEAYLAAA